MDLGRLEVGQLHKQRRQVPLHARSSARSVAQMCVSINKPVGSIARWPQKRGRPSACTVVTSPSVPPSADISSFTGRIAW